MVRFDTATVQPIVPQSHSQRPPLQGSAAVAPTRAPQPLAAQHVQSSAQAPTIHRVSTDFDPSVFPNSGSSVDKNLQLASVELAQLLGSTTWVVPTASLGKTVPQTSLGQAERSDTLRNDLVQPPAVPSTPEEENREAVRTISHLPEQRSPQPQPRVEQTPTRIEPSNNPASQTDSAGRTSTSLESRIASKNQDGEIFRLDRPTYKSFPQAADVYLDEELSSPSDSFDEAVAFAPPPQSIAPDVQKKQQAIAKEKDLRQARVRIFNPLWEVDRLQWPRVCVELLSAVDRESSEVAKNLLHACQEGMQVLAVTSPRTGSGTSTVACCLAMLAGRHGLNVALVDGNTDNPSLCYQTNLDLDVDWQEAIARQLPLEEIAVHSVDDQVTLVPLLARLSAPQFSEQNMAWMLRELAQSFDLVIVDLGHMQAPKNMVATLGDLGALNAVVAVVDHRNLNNERIESCLRQIRQTGVSSIGLVENFAA